MKILQEFAECIHECCCPKIQRCRYLGTKCAMLDLLHIFVGWIILSLTEPKAIIKTMDCVNDISTSIGCSEYWFEIVNIFVLFSVGHSFYNFMSHLFSKSIAKFEPPIFFFLMALFVLFFAVRIAHICYYFEIKLLITAPLLVFQTILYFCHYYIAQMKLMSQNHPIVVTLSSPPPPAYSRISFSVVPNDDNISCSLMEDTNSANEYNL